MEEPKCGIGEIDRRIVWEGERERVIAPYSKLIELLALKSRPGHEKPRLKKGGPSSKAKYSLLTDSERVP